MTSRVSRSVRRRPNDSGTTRSACSQVRHHIGGVALDIEHHRDLPSQLLAPRRSTRAERGGVDRRAEAFARAASVAWSGSGVFARAGVVESDVLSPSAVMVRCASTGSARLLAE